MNKYTVTYSLPYRHVVQVGISASSKQAAENKVRKMLDTGTLWDNTPDVPLLFDDFEEQDASEPLQFEAVRVRAFPKKDASVKQHEQDNALRAFVEQLARMETASEYDERTDGDGMSGDDAVDTVSSLIDEARALLHPVNPNA